MQRYNFLSIIFQKCSFGELIRGNPWGFSCIHGRTPMLGSLFNKVAGCRLSVYKIVQGENLIWLLFCGFCEAVTGVFLTGHPQKTAAQVFLVLIKSRKKSNFCFYQFILIHYYKSYYFTKCYYSLKFFFFSLILSEVGINIVIVFTNHWLSCSISRFKRIYIFLFC